MPLGTDHVINADVGAGWIPELWSDEAIVAYKKRTVMRDLVSVMQTKDKPGSAIHVPTFTTFAASKKSVETQVTMKSPVQSQVVINLDQHWEASFLIEDFTAVQAQPSLRQEYTRMAGYALARQVDYHLHTLGTGLQGGTLDASIGVPDDDPNTLSYDKAVIGSDGVTLWNPSANGNTGNGSAITDAGFRRMIQTLDDADVPFDDRALIIPPVERKNLMGIARYTEWAFRGEGEALKTGQIGDLYGVKVYVSSACPKIRAADGTTKYRVGMLLHRDAFALVEQQSIRSQVQYILQFLGTLYVADIIYGVGIKRDVGGIAFVVPA